MFLKIFWNFWKINITSRILDMLFDPDSILKNSYGFWKINTFIWNEKRISNLIIYYNNYFLYQLISNFAALLLCKMNFFGFFDIGDFFQIFVTSRNTKILMETNYWLGMYVPYILNVRKEILWEFGDQWNKNRQNSTKFYISRTLILHNNNNAKKLLRNRNKTSIN